MLPRYLMPVYLGMYKRPKSFHALRKQNLRAAAGRGTRMNAQS